MYRSKLFIPAKIISVSLILSFISISCKIEKDTVLAPIYPLKKGLYFREPAVISEKMTEFSVIDVDYKWEQNFKNSNNLRPLKIEDYFILQPITIHKNELNFTTINWAKTNQKVLMVAIFKNTIKVEKNEINNKEDIVWIWNSPKK